MMRMFLIAAAALLSFAALAGEAEIRQVLKAKFPNMKVEGVQPAPLAGLFEIRIQSQEGPQIIYSDAQANFFVVQGSLIDAKSGRNLTEERLRKLTAIQFNSLPLDLAVKIQRGGGKRVLAMFTDPYCPYCRKFEQTLLQMDDITVYVFMFPVIRPEYADHSRAVWCSRDRAKAWLDLAAAERVVVPEAAPTCPNPVDKVLELGRSLRVTGTPTLFFADGERASGGIELSAIRAKLDEVAKQPKR